MALRGRAATAHAGCKTMSDQSMAAPHLHVRRMRRAQQRNTPPSLRLLLVLRASLPSTAESVTTPAAAPLAQPAA